jgi:hypothetical protein
MRGETLTFGMTVEGSGTWKAPTYSRQRLLLSFLEAAGTVVSKLDLQKLVFRLLLPPLPGVIQAQTNKRLGLTLVFHYNASAVVKLGVIGRRRCRYVDDIEKGCDIDGAK